MIYPGIKDNYKLSDLNSNFKELADAQVNIPSIESDLILINENLESLSDDKLDKVGDSKGNTATFTEAVTLANIESLETHATLFGKIKKFFTLIGTTVLTTTATTISAAINELSLRISGLETPSNGTLDTPTNVSAVTQHYIRKRCGVIQYCLRATCTMTAGTSYTLVTLPVGYRPYNAFYRNIETRDTSTVLGSLTITAAGVVSVIPRTTISAQLISINEVFMGI